MRDEDLNAGGSAPSGLARKLMLVGAALLAVFGLERLWRGGAGEPDAAAAEARGLITGTASSYDQALARLDLEVRSDSADVLTRRGEWLFEEALARALIGRAKLTGNYEDFAAAQGAIDRAFASAPDGTGPHLTAAMLAFSLHRLDETERLLDAIDNYAVPPGDEERAEIIGMRGDIALYRGNPGEALEHYRRAERLAPGSSDFRMAIYHSQRGEPEQADAALIRVAAALPQRTGRALAHITLQRGIIQLDNGRLEEALARFHEADRLFPGYWLIEEHIAEVLSLTGHEAEAEAMLRDVVRRTSHPEYMDAIANLMRGRGDVAEAQRWTAMARAGWNRRLALFPEAAFGHGIDHCLDAGDAACALDLARRNHQARPFGEAKVKLARALALAGRRPEAEAMLAQAEALGWRPSDIRAAREEMAARR